MKFWRVWKQVDFNYHLFWLSMKSKKTSITWNKTWDDVFQNDQKSAESLAHKHD